MKSKVQFDLNGQDESVVVAQIIYTEDIRDKVAIRFRQGLDNSSNLALVKILPSSRENIEPGVSVNCGTPRRIFGLEIKTVGGGKEKTMDLCQELCDVQLKLLIQCATEILNGRAKELIVVSEDNKG